LGVPPDFPSGGGPPGLPLWFEPTARRWLSIRDPAARTSGRALANVASLDRISSRPCLATAGPNSKPAPSRTPIPQPRHGNSAASRALWTLARSAQRSRRDARTDRPNRMLDSVRSADARSSRRTCSDLPRVRWKTRSRTWSIGDKGRWRGFVQVLISAFRLGGRCLHVTSGVETGAEPLAGGLPRDSVPAPPRVCRSPRSTA
jgi:hypothetical protein